MDRTAIVIVGGLIPAFLFGISAIFQKGAMQAGVGPGSYMIFDGVIFIVVGLVLRGVLREPDFGGAGVPLALIGGLLFALASGAISFALRQWAAPISLIAPITVISSLVTVIAGFIVFREYEGVAAVRLLGGAVLVVVGAALVATS
jgi:drug/metabolite transporter (DMT)-like permease